MHVPVADPAQPPRLVHELHDERRIVRPELAEPEARGLEHGHGRAATRARRASSSARPAGQAPWPESVLMWPAAPASVNVAPHAAAKPEARASETYGSSWLATTCTGNGIARRGMGAKRRISGEHSGDSTSTGATRNAPAA